MRIGELARRSGLSVTTLRYYEQVGILDPPARSPSGYRDYADDALPRLGFSRAAQAIGLSLGEIREIIRFRERGDVPCAHVLALIQRRSVEITQSIADLEKMRADLDALARRARELDPRDCDPEQICHLVPAGPVSRGR